MSTSNAQAKLDYIAGTKTAIKEAIEAKGVNVGDVTFRQFAEKVADIPNGAYSKNIYHLETSGEWIKPAGLVLLEVVCIGGGGGGASGSKQASGIIAQAGGGGGAASMAWHTLLSSELGATESYVVGSGGNGGASVTDNSTNMNAGATGGDSSFGNHVLAKGGYGAPNMGAGGSTSEMFYQKPFSALIGLYGGQSSSSGGSGYGPFSQSGSDNNLKIHGAGGGGGISTSNTASRGGEGARFYNKSGILSPLNRGEANYDGGDGVAGYMDRIPFIVEEDGAFSTITLYGTPGGGGGSSVSGNAGRGGDGGKYGGSGGGGGSARDNTGNSGRGGNGAQGVIILIEHLVS